MMMTAVKEVQERTGEQEGVRKQSEEMLPMFGIEQIGGDESCGQSGQQPSAFAREVHSCILLRRSELPMTLTDDSAIAAAAMIGDSISPNSG